MTTPGIFVNTTTVRLRSGQLITGVRCDAVDGWPYYTGWLAGWRALRLHRWRSDVAAERSRVPLRIRNYCNEQATDSQNGGGTLLDVRERDDVAGSA